MIKLEQNTFNEYTFGYSIEVQAPENKSITYLSVPKDTVTQEIGLNKSAY